MAVPQPSWSRGQDFFRNIPATVVIIALWVVLFLASILTEGSIYRFLSYDSTILFNATIGLITYPLVVGNIIGLLFAGWMMYMFGGSLERGWGTRTFVLFLLASNIAAALVWTLGCFIFGSSAQLATPWLMISSFIVAWAWINPEETILVWFVLPLKARWLGWLTIVILYFSFPRVGGWRFFIQGFFALGGVAVAVGYDWYRRKWGWIPRPRREKKPSSRVIRHPSSSPLGVMLRPYREWQRRRRIAKLQRTFKFDDEGKNTGSGL